MLGEGYPYIERDRANWDCPPRKKWMGSHLRSTNEVTGYNLLASDGEIGHVDDFIIDDETWTIRFSSWRQGTGGLGRRF